MAVLSFDTIPADRIGWSTYRANTISADVSSTFWYSKATNPELLREDSEQRQRTSHKLQLCPEKYLPIVEGVIDGDIKLKDADDEKEDV